METDPIKRIGQVMTFVEDGDPRHGSVTVEGVVVGSYGGRYQVRWCDGEGDSSVRWGSPSIVNWDEEVRKVFVLHIGRGRPNPDDPGADDYFLARVPMSFGPGLCGNMVFKTTFDQADPVIVPAAAAERLLGFSLEPGEYAQMGWFLSPPFNRAYTLDETGARVQ